MQGKGTVLSEKERFSFKTLNAVCWRAQLLQAKGNGKEAIDFMKSVISNNPKNDHLWLTLAELYSNEGENDKAISMIRKAGLILIENGEENNREKMDFLKAKLKQFQNFSESKSTDNNL